MRKELYILVAILLTKAAIMLVFIINGPIELGPDEAQYWTWAQQIDWGYYSKPPGIAWEIWLGTSVLGNSTVGVRILPVIIGILIPLLIYCAARRCTIAPKYSLLAATAFALAPMGILSSLFAITDGGMLVFWTAALAYIAGTIQSKTTTNYLLVGLLVGCAALFKWPAYLLWPLTIAAWPSCRSLRSPTIIIGIAASLLAILPSLHWNSTHEWATFRHVSSTVTGGHTPNKALFAGNPLEYIGSQVAIVSPILFGLIALSFWRILRKWKEVPESIRFCAWITLAIFFGGFGLSLFMKIQGNWAIAAYPSAFVALGWYVWSKEGALQKWLVGGIALSVLLTGTTFAIPSIQSHGLFPGTKIPYKINPFRHNIGWERLGDALTAAGYNPSKDNLIADKYQTVSELSFYGPEQKRAYFLNLMGIRKNQFSYWPGIEKDRFKKSYFVVVENIPQLNKEGFADEYLKHLEPYFGSVKFLGVNPLFDAYGTIAKGALLFECLDFKGKYPTDPDLY